MTNQEQVLEIYKRVIESTIDNVRADLTDKAVPEHALHSLDLLKARWHDRLTKTHDFSEDPHLVDRASHPPARPSKASAANKTPSSSLSRPSAAASASSASASASASARKKHPAPRVPPHALELDPDVVEVPVQQPPTKRPRTSADPANANNNNDDRVHNPCEDLDSSDDDSDVSAGDSDEEAENLILAQHDKVRKGARWKVMLREGIVSIRGREYLFNRATCDLDF